jgi:hypothetical protein
VNPVLIAFQDNSLDQVRVAESLAAGLDVARESLDLTVLLGRVWLSVQPLDTTECHHFSKLSP